MGKAQGLIADILAIIDHCELCGDPVISGDALEIYTIQPFDPADISSLFTNIVVLCPDCKKKFDDDIISRKHLQACVRLRMPETTKSLKDMLDGYDLPGKAKRAGNGRKDSIVDRLINNPAYFERLIFAGGLLVIMIGIFLFALGYQSSGAYSAGTATGQGSADDGIFYLFMELAGVALAFLGAFFLLGQARKPSGTGIKQ